MSETKETSIHREFELERMILFSDAVFAIAITLLIIEIKFPELPEGYKVSLDFWKMFRPTFFEFLAFFMSFFFIGVSWARHLKMFRYLKAYDNGVIFRNLLSLLFIVAFPFSTSGLVHLRPSFMFPILIYLGNVSLIFVSNFLLSYYIFKHKPSLSIPGHEEEKRYIHLQSTAMAIAMALGFLIVLATALITDFNNDSISTSINCVVIPLILMRLWLKRKKPKKVSVFGAIDYAIAFLSFSLDRKQAIAIKLTKEDV